MEVSGQLHAPTSLPLRRSPRYPLDRGWIGPRAGMDNAEKRKIFLLLGIEPWSLSRPARKPSLYRLRYPGSSTEQDRIHGGTWGQMTWRLCTAWRVAMGRGSQGTQPFVDLTHYPQVAMTVESIVIDTYKLHTLWVYFKTRAQAFVNDKNFLKYTTSEYTDYNRFLLLCTVKAVTTWRHVVR
jgi:hypothetical protein